MLFGYFCSSLFIGGGEVNFINILKYLNRCPRCKIGNVFSGLIKLKDYCSSCNIKLNSDKIGDGASWITTSFVCFVLIPILFFFEINIGISVKIYVFVVFPFLVLLSIILLRISRYLLLKKYYDVI
jgi:uncharacterized protein (DUF983 family)